MASETVIQRPIPRRPFESNASPTDSSSTANLEPSSSTLARRSGSSHSSSQNLGVSGSTSQIPDFNRSRSILNLTSSTLFGIYSSTSDAADREDATPRGTGAQTPRERAGVDTKAEPVFASRTAGRPLQRTRSFQHVSQTPLLEYLGRLALRTALLFAVGMGYGLLVTHLHDDQQVAPFQVSGIIRPRYNVAYLVFWGIAGVGLGSLLPLVDTLFGRGSSSKNMAVGATKTSRASENDEDVVAETGLIADWNPVVRSVGAFVGIAFAIRRLPWTSTLQVALTLALVNPVLWYLIDRSKPGLFLSMTVGLLGTSILLALNPEIMPSPSLTPSASSTSFYNNHASHGNATTPSFHDPSSALGGLVSQETIECGTWIISVLFCSCVCFGNIGRKLALTREKVTLSRDSFQ